MQLLDVDFSWQPIHTLDQERKEERKKEYSD